MLLKGSRCKHPGLPAKPVPNHAPGARLRPPCSTQRSLTDSGQSTPIEGLHDHLQRSLDLGPALKQAPDFEYTAVAFKTQPKRPSKHERPARRNQKQSSVSDMIFGAPDDSGFRSMEVVSGDRRLLFEDGAAQGQPSTSDRVQSASPPENAARGMPPGKPATGTSRQGQDRRPGTQRMQEAHSSCCPDVNASSSDAAPTKSRGSAPPAPSPAPPPASPRTSRPPAPRSADPHRSAPSSASTTPHHHQHEQRNNQQQKQHHAEPPPQRQWHRRHHGKQWRGHRPRPRSPTAAIEEAACALLTLPLHQLQQHQHRRSGLLIELHALAADRPHDLEPACAALREGLGADPHQLTGLLCAQPHLLRLPPARLAAAAAALAAALDVACGSPELAEAALAVPDVLLRYGQLGSGGVGGGGGDDGRAVTGVCDALAEALSLQHAQARALLRACPRLLRQPPASFRRCLSALSRAFYLPPPDVAALAASEPALLAASPGALSANATTLRTALQLAPPQLAALAATAPHLLLRPPGTLNAVAHRLVTRLRTSPAWSEVQFPRLIMGSPRNLAVALSFAPERYERLDYLAMSGRDRVMGFKDALTMEEEEFAEVFPGFAIWKHRDGR